MTVAAQAGQLADWFTVDDGGRATSRRPKQQNDCAVIAYAIVTGQPYDIVYDRFATGGRRSFRGTDDGFLHALMNQERWEGQTFPAIKGQRRMNPPTFVARFPEGRYLVSTARHLSAVIEGVWRDTFAPFEDRCIYRVWRFPHEWVPAT